MLEIAGKMGAHRFCAKELEGSDLSVFVPATEEEFDSLPDNKRYFARHITDEHEIRGHAFGILFLNADTSSSFTRDDVRRIIKRHKADKALAAHLNFHRLMATVTFAEQIVEMTKLVLKLDQQRREHKEIRSAFAGLKEELMGLAGCEICPKRDDCSILEQSL
jgi:hypothetical protein